MGGDDKHDDASYIRIPTTLAVAIISSGVLLILGFSEFVWTGDNDKFAPLEASVSEIRAEHRVLQSEHRELKEALRVWSEIASSNSHRIQDNRQSILDNTGKRWTSEQEAEYQRTQDARDDAQERSLMLLERDIDKLNGTRPVP